MYRTYVRYYMYYTLLIMEIPGIEPQNPTYKVSVYLIKLYLLIYVYIIFIYIHINFVLFFLCCRVRRSRSLFGTSYLTLRTVHDSLIRLLLALHYRLAICNTWSGKCQGYKHYRCHGLRLIGLSNVRRSPYSIVTVTPPLPIARTMMTPSPS